MKRLIIVMVCFCCGIAGYGDEDGWDIARLDTARTVDYLSAVEKDIVLELNKVRSNPKKYAELYIKPQMALFNGTSLSYRLPSGMYMTTNEGVKAVRECYDALCAAPSSPLLTPSRGMSRAAKDHVNDQGPKGTTGHNSSNGNSPWDRLNRYGTWGKNVAENISYGDTTGRGIVVQLLIDDGVSSRGHRENNMGRDFAFIGVAAGTHKGYGAMSVLDFAAVYTEKNTTGAAAESPGKVSPAPAPAQVKPQQQVRPVGRKAAVTIVNRTGNSVKEVYISTSNNDYWGDNIQSGILRNGASGNFSVDLRAPAYDIALCDVRGNWYYKYDVKITNGLRLEFTDDDHRESSD